MINGWERVTFFRPDNKFHEQHSYRFANAHEYVEAEVHTVTNCVGVAEISGFNCYEITGKDSEKWLDGLTCSRLPKHDHSVGLCYFLNPSGTICSEATVTRLSKDRMLFGSAAMAEDHDMNWLLQHLPAKLDITITSRTNSHTVLLVAGPRTRSLLASLSPRTQWSQQSFPWMTARQCHIGHIEVIAMAISYSGEQAFELHVHNSQLYALYQTDYESWA